MHQQVSQTVDSSKLVDVASRYPEHLINAVFFVAPERLLEGLFELSGRQKLDMHAMKAA